MRSVFNIKWLEVCEDADTPGGESLDDMTGEADVLADDALQAFEKVRADRIGYRYEKVEDEPDSLAFIVTDIKLMEAKEGVSVDIE